MRNRFFRLGLFALLITLLFSSCNTNTGEQPNTQRVLGFFEFDFIVNDDGTITASARETPPEALGIDSQVLSRIGATGVLTVSGKRNRQSTDTTGVTRPGANATFLHAFFDVTNNSSNDYENVTFLAYSSTSSFETKPGSTVFKTQRDGTPYSIVSSTIADPPPPAEDRDPRLIVPSGRVNNAGGIGTNAFNRPVATSDATDFVAYTETEVGLVSSGFESDFSFVNTVFPWGFVTRASNLATASRTLTSGSTGQVGIGFRGPGILGSLDPVRRVKFHAVAVVDSEERIAQVISENYRSDTDDTSFNSADGWVATIQRSQDIGSDGGSLDRVVYIGNMQDIPANNSFGVRGGIGISCSLFTPLDDLRIAGGWSGGPAATFAIDYGNNSTENGAISDITPGTVSQPVPLPSDCGETINDVEILLSSSGNSIVGQTFTSGSTFDIDINAVSSPGVIDTSVNAELYLFGGGFAITSGGGPVQLTAGQATSVTITVDNGGGNGFLNVQSGLFERDFFITVN